MVTDPDRRFDWVGVMSNDVDKAFCYGDPEWTLLEEKIRATSNPTDLTTIIKDFFSEYPVGVIAPSEVNAKIPSFLHNLMVDSAKASGWYHSTAAQALPVPVAAFVGSPFSVQPILIPEAGLLTAVTDFEVVCPDLDELTNIDGTDLVREKFDVAPPPKPTGSKKASPSPKTTTTTFKGILLIPQLLAVDLLRSTDASDGAFSAFDVAAHLYRSAVMLDQENDEATVSSRGEILPFIDNVVLFLWAMHHGFLPATTTSVLPYKISESLRKQRLSRFAPQALSAQPPSPQNSMPSTITSPMIEQLATAITQPIQQAALAQINASQSVASQMEIVRDSSSSTKGIHKLASTSQKALRLAQVVDVSHGIPSDFSENTKELYKVQTLYTFANNINDGALGSVEVTGNFALNHANALMRHGVKWCTPQQPFGFTCLGVVPNKELGAAYHQAQGNMSALEFRSENSQKWKDEDIELVTNNKLMLPQSSFDMQRQVKAMHSLSSFLLGPEATVTTAYKHVHDAMVARTSRFESLYKSGNNFGIRFLYAIDIRVQDFIEDLLLAEASDNWEAVNTDTLLTSIEAVLTSVRQRNFTQDLPDGLLTSTDSPHKRKRDQVKDGGQDSSISKPSGKSDKENKKKKDKDPLHKRTFDADPTWSLSDRKDYGKFFTPATLKRMPKAKHPTSEQQMAYCNKFLCLGACSSTKCPFVHEDPSIQGKKDEVSAFYAQAYSE